jgi:hypothetical protein
VEAVLYLELHPFPGVEDQIHFKVPEMVEVVLYLELPLFLESRTMSTF